MLNLKKYKAYIATRDEVNIDDMLLAQGILPDSSVRKKSANQLRKDGWVEAGVKMKDGRARKLWKRNNRVDGLDLDVKRLDLLCKRQDQDVRTIEKLLADGFTRGQVMDYLRMLYHCETDALDRYQAEETEAKEFADLLAAQANTKYAASRMISCTAYVFYVDKYFPELSTEDLYEQSERKIRACLVCKKGDSASKYEWGAISFDPHFLDLTTKMSDEGDYGEYKKWLIKRFIRQETIDKLFKDGLEYRKLAALCVIARRVMKGGEFRAPYGVKPSEAKAMKKHCEGLKIEHE